MDASTFCSLSGVCYDLASQFLLKVPWDRVLKDTVTVGSKKVWSSRNAYALVLKEAQLAQSVFAYFRQTVRRLDNYQKLLGVNICSLEAAKEFIKDFERVLSMYEPDQVTTWQANVAGESLRQQLQFYLTFAQSLMGTLSTELQFVTLQLQAIQMETKASKKRKLLDALKHSCAREYGGPEDAEEEYFDAE
jgi:hypothetical protein